MLDFAEVGRRIAMRQQMAPTGVTVAHVSIVAPVVGTLLDPEYTADGKTLITQHEAISLGQTLQRQAELLDMKEQEVAHLSETTTALNELCGRLERRVWWLVAGTVVAGAWLSAIIIAVAIAR